MKRLLTWLSRRRYPYEPLITVNISRERLLHNLHEFMRIAPEGAVAPVLKSNAYGHGLIEVARILEAEYLKSKHAHTIPFFVIDSFFEAVALRAAGVKAPLLIIGYTRPETIARSRLRHVAFTVTSIETLEQIRRHQTRIFPEARIGLRTIPIHIKIDTGMRRQGIMPDEIDKIAHIVEINPSLTIVGICTHFSDADNADTSSTESQLHIWNKVVTRFKNDYAMLRYIHASNTDGHRFVTETHANVSRLGLGLYGLIDGESFATPLDLRPVMSMETITTGVKKLCRDETAGYSNTFKAKKDMVIATIPVGYYEGVDRRLSNTGTVLVGTEKIPCPIIGRVSMNITIIDVSHVPTPEATIGTKVVVMSDESTDANSIVSMAKTCTTIPYEIAVHVPAHLKRVIV